MSNWFSGARVVRLVGAAVVTGAFSVGLLSAPAEAANSLKITQVTAVKSFKAANSI